MPCSLVTMAASSGVRSSSRWRRRKNTSARLVRLVARQPGSARLGGGDRGLDVGDGAEDDLVLPLAGGRVEDGSGAFGGAELFDR